MNIFLPMDIPCHYSKLNYYSTFTYYFPYVQNKVIGIKRASTMYLVSYFIHSYIFLSPRSVDIIAHPVRNNESDRQKGCVLKDHFINYIQFEIPRANSTRRASKFRFTYQTPFYQALGNVPCPKSDSPLCTDHA